MTTGNDNKEETFEFIHFTIHECVAEHVKEKANGELRANGQSPYISNDPPELEAHNT